MVCMLVQTLQQHTIMAAHETLKAEGKDRKVEIFGNCEAKE